jgi:hypothetical protein
MHALHRDLFVHPESQNELFAPNSWYGSARIIKNYTHWKLPLPLIVPHGVCLSSSFVWQAEVNCGLKRVYSFPRHRRKAYENGSSLEPIEGASPWLYLLRGKNGNKTKVIETLAFPAHSTHHVEAKTDDEAYASFLSKLQDKSGPVAVCMYWRDIQLGRYAAFLRKGLRVLSAGHIFDEMFFERLLHILQHTKRIHSPSVGSHLFYAASIGCHVTYEMQSEIEHSAPESVKARDNANTDKNLLDQITRMFSEEVAVKEQQGFAEQFLGKNNLKSPAGLFGTLARSALSSRAWWRTAIRKVPKSRRHLPQDNCLDAPFNVNSDTSIYLRALS